MRKQIIAYTIALIGVISAFFIADYPKPSNTGVRLVSKPPENPFKQAVAASGLLESLGNNIPIRSSIAGIIERVFVKTGEYVKKGDFLFQIDSRTAEAAIETKTQDMLIFQETFMKNQSQLNRLYAVKDSRAVSIEDIRNKEYDVKIAEKTFRSSLGSLLEAYALFDQYIVTAPKDAQVIRCDIREGDYFGFDPSFPEEQFCLGETKELQVRIDVDETNIFRVRENQKAVGFTRGVLKTPIPLSFLRIEPLAIPKRSLTGASDERIDTRVVQVFYKVEEFPKYPIYPGQQVDVFIDAPLPESVNEQVYAP